VKLLTFDIFEKVQPEWFKKHPNFYLSKTEKELGDYKKKSKDTEISKQDYINQLKKLDINDIKFSYSDEQKQYSIISPSFLIRNRFRLFSQGYSCSFDELHTEYNYKILIALIKFMDKETVVFEDVDKNLINPLFKELSDYYGLFYNFGFGEKLYLTRNREEYKNKITELRKENSKIYYFNNKTKGKEFTDIELLEINNTKNKLKKITIDDIYFTKDDWSDEEGSLSKRVSYSVKFKDKELNSKMYLYGLIHGCFFTREDSPSKVYFGHLRNRYHTSSISSYIQGIGVGYKIYKAFLKFNGYMVSDEQTSLNARKIYLNLMKDDDVYFIVDKKGIKDGTYASDSSKVMLIWKDYPKMEQLVRIVRTHELRNKRHYEYDKDLLPYVKNINKKTV
jgi:hypothetical protein